jgi:hypothetical protein
MFKRKLLGLVITSIVTVAFIIILFSEGEMPVELFSMIGAISLFVLPGVLLYGLPVSVLSDKLTKSLNGFKRVLLSLVIHLFFGLSFVFIIGIFIAPENLFTSFNQFWRDAYLFFAFSTLVSLLYWSVDEVLRLVLNKKTI